MKKTKNVLTVAVMIVTAVLLASCGSSPSAKGGGVPSGIRDWIDKQGDGIVYGLGISEAENESDAQRQASNLARSDLAAKLEARVATISKDFLDLSEKNGEKSRIAKFQEGTKQLINATIERSNARLPEINSIGNTYIIIYVDAKKLDGDIIEVVDEVFGDLENELNEQLGKN
jgi:hypothetical protein